MKQRKHLFDNKQNIKRVLYLLYVVCVLLFLLDFIVNRHASHPLDAMPGFYPLYGFIGCVLLVIIAKWMRALIKRSQDYYTCDASNTSDTSDKRDERKLAGKHHQDSRQNHVDD